MTSESDTALDVSPPTRPADHLDTAHDGPAVPPDVAFVDLARALAAWRDAIGDDKVAVEDSCRSYEANCIGATRAIPVALSPTAEREVQKIVEIARRFGVPLYPISTGRNWGYGSAVPTADRSVVVDLSGMRRITAFDPELGLITVEPGVTQGQLHTFLTESGHDFMVPTTGAGPSCSLVGNALERGYGITPYGDHFAAVRSIQAVLPNGQLYRGALTEAGGGLVDGCHKWGVGPYIDGLFTQGGFGIVTKMTIALAPRPERIEAFLVEIANDDALEPAIAGVRGLLQESGGGISGINLMNQPRLLSMFHPYPHDQVPPGAAMPARMIEDLGQKSGLPRWLGLGALYGDRAVVAAQRGSVRRRLGQYSRKIRFVSGAQTRLAMRLSPLLPSKIAARAAVGAKALDILSGYPEETALRLAYWKMKQPPKPGVPLNPSRDGCGIVWFAPLVPLKAAAARAYVSLVNDICPRFGFEPLVTLTTISPQCFDSTVPLLFDPKRDLDRARSCFLALYEASAKQGWLPYRLNIQSMGLFTQRPDSTYWSLVRRLKDAIDPDNLMAPGRYAP